MLTTERIPGTGIVLMEYGGSLHEPEMAAAKRAVEQAVEDTGTARLLVVYGHLGPVTPAALIEDLKLLPMLSRIERIAWVTDRRWLEAVANIEGRIVPPEVRVFPAEDRDDALVWLRS